MTAAEQTRSYLKKLSHKDFSRRVKARHDDDTIELLTMLKKARIVYNNHGVNPAEIDAILVKHGVKS